MTESTVSSASIVDPFNELKDSRISLCEALEGRYEVEQLIL